MQRKTGPHLGLGASLVVVMAVAPWIAGCGAGDGGAGETGLTDGSGGPTGDGDGDGDGLGDGGGDGDGDGDGGTDHLTDELCGPALLDGHAAGTPLVVGAGDIDGRVASTPDGLDWYDETSVTRGPGDEGHTRNLLRDIAYGGGVWVAVGGYDNAYMVITCDGLNFQHDVLGTNVDGDLDDFGRGFLAAVAYLPGPNVFVAVGAEGRRTISEDHGATWNDTDRVWGQYRDIVAAEGRLVAVGRDEGAGMISISDDGEHWVDVTPPGEDLEWLAHAAGQFVTLGAQGGCWTSDDGAVWTSCDLQLSASWNLVGVDDRFWALGPEGVFTSTDGEHWSTSEFPLPAQLVGAFGGFVMANDGIRGFAPDLETSFETVQLGAGGLRGLAAGIVRREVGL